jgi:hypothetical protein
MVTCFYNPRILQAEAGGSRVLGYIARKKKSNHLNKKKNLCEELLLHLK